MLRCEIKSRRSHFKSKREDVERARRKGNYWMEMDAKRYKESPR
jgi:hypothetical protein